MSERSAFIVELEANQRARLDELKAQTGLSRSAVLRRLIESSRVVQLELDSKIVMPVKREPARVA